MSSEARKTALVLLPIVLAAVVMFPTVNNGWLSWDDKFYILDNPLVKQFNWGSIRAIFSSFSFNGGYTPIPMLSWAINYSVSGPDAFSFHVVNFLIHLANVGLCYLLVFRLVKNRFSAFTVAVLFGIHPVHLEPVAWITGRKDLLLGLFSLSTLISWIYFLESGSKRWKWYVFTLALFVLALLSKATAVVLPIWMILISIFNQRLHFRALISHIPFFGLSLMFGLVAIWSQRDAGALDVVSNIEFSESFCWAFHALGTYIVKAVFPYHIGPYHPYPQHQSMFFMMIGCAAVLLAFLAVFSLVKRKRHIPAIGFVILLVGLTPVLQFLPVGFALTADRYTYLPFIGGYMIIAHFTSPDDTVTSLFNYVKSGFLLVFMCVLGYQTRTHAGVWGSDETLWTHEIAHHARAPRAFVNRGQYYLSNDEYDKALADFSKAISQEPDLKEAYQQQGLALQALRRFDEAERSFTQAVQIDSSYVAGWLNLGLNAVYQGQVETAFEYFDRVEELEPTNMLHLLNKGMLFESQGDFEMALFNYEKAVLTSPLDSRGYRYKGVLHFRQKRYNLALNDFQTCSGKEARNPMIYRWLARTHAAMGRSDLFYANAKQAQILGEPLSDSEFKELEMNLDVYSSGIQSESSN